MIISSEDPEELGTMAQACGIGGEALHAVLEGESFASFAARLPGELSEQEIRERLRLMANDLVEWGLRLDGLARRAEVLQAHKAAVRGDVH